jgi:hypothetical protein
LFAGPQLNAPAKAPAVVSTEGMTVVKSTSETVTPGDIENAIFVSLNYFSIYLQSIIYSY